MIILEERLAKKALNRKQITIKVIIHESTISKIKDDQILILINELIKFKSNSNEKIKGYNSIRLFWTKLFLKIPLTKLNKRFRVGEHHIFNIEGLFLKTRNTDRLQKTQIVELCYFDKNI